MLSIVSRARLGALALPLFIGLTVPGQAIEPQDPAPLPLPVVRPELPKPIQYVTVSFDGAGGLKMWRESMAFAAANEVKFTYLLSCVYLLTWDNKRLYQPPRAKAGTSRVGFARTSEEISERLDAINRAMDRGHEIGSHGCGHFDGGRWSKRDWLTEFEAFDDIVQNAYVNNNIDGEPETWRKRIGNAIKGFRAPYLSRNKALHAAMSEHGMTYDTSGVGRMGEPPFTTDQGLWDFRLALIPEGPRQRKLVSMDYNFYVRHSGGKPMLQKAGSFEERTYQALKSYFDHAYEGHRHPVHIGYHFAFWNGAAYWRALKRVLRETCTLDDVRCVTYSELVDTLEPKSDPKEIALLNE